MQLAKFFSYLDYKKLINDVVQELPRHGYGQLNQLSQQIGVHSSLMSQVFRGDKDLSLEQGLKVADFFEMTARETEYFMLLLSYAKSSTTQLRKFYKGQIESMQQSIQSVSSRMPSATELKESDRALYYSDWSYIAIWLATSLANHQRAKNIGDSLKLDTENVERVLLDLVKMGLCQESETGFVMNIQKTHLPASSPLVKRHHINWRLKAIEHIPAVHIDELIFTAPMTLSKEDFFWLKHALLDLIESTSNRVKTSESEILACLNIDLFHLSKHEKN
jgi:uncharacterized protein (TIGR02147 family)